MSRARCAAIAGWLFTDGCTDGLSMTGVEQRSLAWVSVP